MTPGKQTKDAKTPGKQTKAAKDAKTPAPGAVQLTRNIAGHQFGETMPRRRAEELGILDATRPFPDAKTR